MKDQVQPPVAKVVPKELSIHGHTRVDNYFWLNQREDAEVINYLKAENAYTDKVMEHTKEFQEKLFGEIKGRIKEDDNSVPYKLDDYYYYYRYEKGKEYPIYCRKQGSLDQEEEIILNVNELAKEHKFFATRGLSVSKNHKLLAYAADTKGRRIYTIYFKNLETGEMLPEQIPDVTSNIEWANDNKTLFYTKQDLQTLRWDKVYKHSLGTDPKEDKLVYEEKDVTFSAYVEKSKSNKYIFIETSSTLSAETWYLDADKPNNSLQCINPREEKHEYSVIHVEDKFYILTNDQATNFRLMETPISATTKSNWKEVIPHDENVLLRYIDEYQHYLIIAERKNGLSEIRIFPLNGEKSSYVDFGEQVYMASIGYNPDYASHTFRYNYQSMTTPNSTIDFNIKTQEKTIQKEQEVLGEFDKNEYFTERLFATASDGTQIPISIVYKKSLKKDGNAPCLLYAYGSYGSSMEPYFSSSRLTLLNRGFVYAIAHIRGGSEMGRKWYEDGKMLKKKNTFTDFIACGEHLIAEKYTTSEHLYAMGGSAGGLLMGAVANMKPGLFNGIVAQVPFVDVITTMLDESIPLTTSEYDEWGNPNDKEYYEYILSYSPYDNVEKKAYPHMLITTGLHDSQVQYWEPAKWVAKLRAYKTDNNRLLLHTNMDAGHGGASGRYQRYKELAEEFAFIFDLENISQ